jgi:hypothetical protein
VNGFSAVPVGAVKKAVDRAAVAGIEVVARSSTRAIHREDVVEHHDRNVARRTSSSAMALDDAGVSRCSSASSVV